MKGTVMKTPARAKPVPPQTFCVACGRHDEPSSFNQGYSSCCNKRITSDTDEFEDTDVMYDWREEHAQ